jgi:Flp pilus assembly pilin Flp
VAGLNQQPEGFMAEKITRNYRSEEGQGLVEYALIIALVALAISIALGGFGTSLMGIYQNINAIVGSL